MEGRITRVIPVVVIVAAAAHVEPIQCFLDRNPYHGQPRSIRETRRAQRRGGRR